MKKEKKGYTSPQMLIFEVLPQGVVCVSTGDVTITDLDYEDTDWN